MTLADLKTGESAIITNVGGDGSLRQHFLDMGVLQDTHVRLMRFAPMGDPMELRLHGYELTLRKEDARLIEVRPVEDVTGNEAPAGECCSIQPVCHELEHPGLGEEGPTYHDSSLNPQPSALSQNKISIALVGNQNCGKTTLFNQLTGSNQHVGNFPGVTVERKSGQVKGHPEVVVTDLPGIYSLSPYTSEEIVSRRFILEEHPTAIINIVDATCIERNLYLTMQLMELGIPMVLALNMMDEVENNGGTIHINEMESLLGIPVIPISALRNEGVDEVVKHVLHVAKYDEGPLRQDFCSPEEHGGSVHRCLHAIMHLIEDHAERVGIPMRFAAAKLIEEDNLIQSSLHLSQNEKETVEHILQQMEEERGLDRKTAITSMRYEFIDKVCQRTVVHPHESKEYVRSQRIDRILTGKWTGIPSFCVILALVFYLTFNTLGAWLQDLCQMGIDWVTQATERALVASHIAAPVQSLIIDGIYGGVGTVLVFLPLILMLFFFLSMLEDTGYMARIAFVMDRPLRHLGLSGRSIVPLLIGFGCSVPSVMSSRTLPSQRDRRLTILLTPFMSCTAKIPIYAFFAAAFFPQSSGWIMMSLYAIGIFTGIIVALVLKRTAMKGEAVPFVMELPNYRLPALQNVMHLMWDKAKDFLQRAFTIIFLASIVIWFLQSFNFHIQMVEEGMEHESMLAQMASVLSPIFSLHGFGDWRVVTSLVSGLLAKEVVVSTLSALFAGIPMTEVFTAGSAYSLMVFCLLYTPCIAAVSTIRRELGGSWALSIILFQCIIAWCISLLFALLLN